MTEAEIGTLVIVKGPPSEVRGLAHIARLGKIVQVEAERILVMFKETDEAWFNLAELEILDWPLIEIDEPKMEVAGDE